MRRVRSGVPGDGDFRARGFAVKVGEFHADQRRLVHQEEVARRAANRQIWNAASLRARRIFVFSASSWLSLERGNAAAAGRAGECALADVVKRGLEEDVLHRALNILPELFEAARVAFGAGIRMRLVHLDTTGLGKLAVYDAQHLADGNLFRRPRQSIAATDAP